MAPEAYSGQALPSCSISAALKRFIQSEVGAIVLWALSSLIIAAVFVPWLYSGGKQFAAYAANNELSALWEWLAGACDRAHLGRYHNRAMLFSALCLLPILIRRIRHISRQNEAGTIISSSSIGAKNAIIHLFTACLIAGGILWLAGMSLEFAGAYVNKTEPIKITRLLKKALVPAITASFVEEWIFRGLLLGLWLRTAKPIKACIGSSLLFSFLHFLNPPGFIGDPSHVFSGFELLGKTLIHFADPLFFATEFVTLTTVGLILCWARLRTNSLWFPIGLHIGWVLALKAYGLLFQQTTHHWLKPWGIGDSLRSGLVPLLALAVTAVVCYFVLNQLCPKQPRES